MSDTTGIHILRRAEIELCELIQIAVCIDDEATPVRCCDLQADVRAQAIDHQPFAHRFRHGGRQDEPVSAVDHQQTQQGNDAALRITPRCWQASPLGQSLHILGELTLQKLAGIAAGDADHLVDVG